MDEVNKIVSHKQEHNKNFHRVHNAWRKNTFSNKQEYYNRSNYRYYNNAEYGTNRGGFNRSWNRPSDRNYRRKNGKISKKQPSRPNSADEEGTEEYMNKKIQQTSAIIMRHLLSPEESVIPLKNADKSITEDSQLDDTGTNSEKKSKRKRKGNNEPECSYIHKNKKHSSYNIEGIHDKIMSHLSNLNDGRKKNLISNTTSVYDDAINNILKQKRLEISRALRSVYLKSSDVGESSDLINSIIPDMGIKIEDLPAEVLEELQTSLSNLENFEEFTNFNYSADTVANTPNADRIEVIDDNDTFLNASTTEEVVEIFQSDVLISTPGYHDFNDTDFSINAAIDLKNPANSVEATSHHNVHKSPSQLGAASYSDSELCSSRLAGTCSDPLDAGTCSTQLDAGTRSIQPDARICSPLNDAGTCSTGLNARTCSTQLDARPCSTLDDAGTCSTELDARTSSTQIDEGTSSNWLDMGRRSEDIQSPITVSDESVDDLDHQTDANPHRNRPDASKKTTQLKDDIMALLLRKQFKNDTKTLPQAVKRMFLVDKCIAKLTEYRQTLFTDITEKSQVKRRAKKERMRRLKEARSIKIAQPVKIAPPDEIEHLTEMAQWTEMAQSTEMAQPIEIALPAKIVKDAKKAEKAKPTKSTKTAKGAKSTGGAEKQAKNVKKKRPKKRKHKDKLDTDVAQTISATQAASVLKQSEEVQINLDSVIEESRNEESNCVNLDADVVRVKEESLSVDFVEIDVIPQVRTTEEAFLDFNDIKEKVLVLKVCKNKFLAATESGKIYIYNLTTRTREETLQVTSLPITSLVFMQIEDSKPYLFVGSCESSLKVYNMYSTSLLHSFFLDDSVQCMDEQWGYLFLGCLRGTIIRYSIKKEQLEYEEQFSSDPVLVLKATVEGARKVLLIGSRDSPVIVRDAMSGLLLRKLKIMYPTVYSMIMHKHYVICGTKTFDILLFNFHNGNLEHTFKATTAKGVACMKVVGKCLFASCYNGKIYVFNLETKTLVDTMCGPGGVIISMEVLTNQVIVGTLSFKIGSIPITHSVLSQMR